jgi:hypothetical protein
MITRPGKATTASATKHPTIRNDQQVPRPPAAPRLTPQARRQYLNFSGTDTSGPTY